MNNEDDEYRMHLSDCKLKAIFTLGIIMMICFEAVTSVFSLTLPNYRCWKDFRKSDLQHTLYIF